MQQQQKNREEKTRTRTKTTNEEREWDDERALWKMEPLYRLEITNR